MTTQITTITKAERDAIVARDERLRAYCVEQGFTSKRTGRTSYKPEQVAHLNPPTNDERSNVEVYDFVNDPPEKYFLYVSEDKRDAHTWTGQHLGNVRFGREYRDNFGGKRIPVTVYAVNGFRYVGIYFKSSGDFARVRKAAGQ